MRARLSNDRKDLQKALFPIMRCPKCGYESTVTNVCRTCMKNMVYTGYVRRHMGRKRKYVPKNDDEKLKLHIGWAVVFEDGGASK